MQSQNLWLEVFRFCRVRSILSFASTCAANFHLSHHSVVVLSSWRPRSVEEIRSVVKTRPLQIVDVYLVDQNDDDSSNFCEIAGDELLLLSCAVNLRSFGHAGEQYMIPNSTIDAFWALLRCLPRLSELLFNSSFLGRVVCNNMLPGNITTLSLVDCRVRSSAYHEHRLTDVPILSDSSALVSLDLSSNEEMRDCSFLIRLEQCSSLTSLNLSRCWNLSSDHLLSVASTLPSLTSLGLNGWCFDEEAPSVLSAFAQLRSLDLSYCSFSHAFVPAEVPSLASLHFLGLRGCKGIHSEIVEYVSKHIVHLDLIDTQFHRELDLVGICSVIFPCLRILELNASLTSVSHIPSFIGRCPSLIRLHLTGVDSEEEQVKIRNLLPSSLICKFLPSMN
eukprot:GILK01011725.1.p1 GENE.GILK01011725.1~~GILK01011725.1.p1  ORF type:complete len:399 (+),score=21.73 GILK01011725.1:25-1197(+)